MDTILIAKIIYLGSYLVFPFLLFFLYLFLYTKHKRKVFFIIPIILSILFIWMRFIEPQIITVQEQKIDIGFSAKIALISDIHLGVYKDKTFLQRVVQEINKKHPDYVFIAGDLLYKALEENLTDIFSPLKEINSPVIAIYGNHDTEYGNRVKQQLKKALESNNVILLENEAIKLENFTLLGLGERWEYNDEVSLLEEYSEKNNIIVLAHNPDTTSDYTNNHADLTLAGHTHGGQIRIPFLYKYAIPTKGDFDRGLIQQEKTKLFISSGLGEVALPLRLFNPPVIDILYLE